MKHPLLTFIKLYGPLALSITILSLLLAIDSNSFSAKAVIVPFGLLSFEIQISSLLLVRCAIIAGAALPLVAFLIYDFSKFFPDRFELTVFFDADGIARTLSLLSPSERILLRIPEEYEQDRRKYYEKMDQDLARTFSDNPEYIAGEGFYALNAGRIRGEGVTSFKLSKIGGGLQYYRIDAAEGNIRQVLEREEKADFSFESRFDLYPSAADLIRGSVIDIYWRREFLFRPTFKQVLSDRSDRRKIHHLIISAFKVYFFPYPHVSDILYLWECGEARIPVAYALATQPYS